MRALLQGFRDEIAAFNTECEASEHTDTGDAWDLLNSIHRRSNDHLEEAGKLEFQRVICLSTSHVTKRDMTELLEKTECWQPIFTARHTYGAFIYIPAEGEDSLETFCSDAADYGYSDSFIKLIRWGAENKARYLHLDADGPILAWAVELDELDTHEW